MLAQIATDVKSNEITAVPQLLAMPSLRGTIVTTDALNCQRAIAGQIVDQGGDYVLALKQNQGTLHNDPILLLDDPASNVSTAAVALARCPPFGADDALNGEATAGGKWWWPVGEPIERARFPTGRKATACESHLYRLRRPLSKHSVILPLDQR